MRSARVFPIPAGADKEIQVIRHDGHGGLTIEDRPFALQVDDTTIDLGIVAQ